VIKVVSSAK